MRTKNPKRPKKSKARGKKASRKFNEAAPRSEIELVFDTNAVLHLKALPAAEMWTAKTSARSITCVIPDVVIGELDRHASSHPDEGMKNRARERRNMLRDHFLTKKTIAMPQSMRIVQAHARKRPSTHADEDVIAEVKQRAKAGRTALVTRDGTMAIRAKARGLDVVVLDPEDEAPVPADPTLTKRIGDLENAVASLRKKLDALEEAKGARPFLKLHRAGADDAKWPIAWTFPSPPSDDEIERQVTAAVIEEFSNLRMPQMTSTGLRAGISEVEAFKVDTRESLLMEAKRATWKVLEVDLEVTNIVGGAHVNNLEVEVQLPPALRVFASLAGAQSTVEGKKVALDQQRSDLTLTRTALGTRASFRRISSIARGATSRLPPLWIIATPEDPVLSAPFKLTSAELDKPVEGVLRFEFNATPQQKEGPG